MVKKTASHQQMTTGARHLTTNPGTISSPPMPFAPPGAPERVFFRRIETINIPALVARRLRSAIGLGLISNGEKLPKESELAVQLGISTSSLREGLGILREEGLIVTRPGKNGGSFVRTPAESTLIAEEALTELSAAELRDLGDWRDMLAAHSATLAAMRASERETERLSAFAQALMESTSLRTATRALNGFHTELALGAQSIRLSNAQFTMYEEYDWLTSILLTDASHRERLAETMHGIAQAVSDNDIVQARLLSSDMISFITTQLTQIRLQLLADVHQPLELPDSRNAVDTITTTLQALCRHVLGLLTEMAEALSTSVGPDSTEEDVFSTLSRFTSVLPGRIDPTIFGVCFLTEPGFLSDYEYFMSNWERNNKQVFEKDKHHVLDPESDDFYDYPSLESFTNPRQKRSAFAAGPYIDQGGVDDYLITVGVPVIKNENFIGVASADIRVTDLERLLSSSLARTNPTLLVINGQCRIIVSNSPDHAVGNLIHNIDEYLVTKVGYFDWLILSREG